MNKYYVSVNEIVRRLYQVEAENPSAALDVVQDNGPHDILDEDWVDFCYDADPDYDVELIEEDEPAPQYNEIAKQMAAEDIADNKDY